jgi:hypothetical protein
LQRSSFYLFHSLDTNTGPCFNASFGFMCIDLRCTRKCAGCHRTATNRERGFKIDISLPCDADDCAENVVSIQSCIDAFFGVESVPDYKCTCCNQSGHCQKQYSLVEPAEILVCYVKWFIPDRGIKDKGQQFRLHKNKCGLSTYRNIVIPVEDSSAGSSAKYGLCGLVFHNGRSIDTGHFTCVGRASTCVAGRCSGMVNATQTCDEHGWRFWNDGEVSKPLCFNDAIRQATNYSIQSLDTDGHPILNSESSTPAMFFYTRLADDSSHSLVSRWAFCTRGDTWREGM